MLLHLLQTSADLPKSSRADSAPLCLAWLATPRAVSPVRRPIGSMETVGPLSPRPEPLSDGRPDFYTLSKVSNYINVVGIACCLFMLISFAFLPVEKPNRNFLSVCLVLAIVLMQVRTLIVPARSQA